MNYRYFCPWVIRVFFSIALTFGCYCAQDVETDSLRPGVSLLDALEGASLEEFPTTNVAGEISQRILKPFRLRTLPIPPREWANLGIPPSRFSDATEGRADLSFWEIRPFLYALEGADSLCILIDGHVVTIPCDDRVTPFPDPCVWWNERTLSLHALSPEPPQGISVEYTADPRLVFGHYELYAFANTTDVGEARLRPVDLVRQVGLGDTTKRCLFLPAPGRVSIPVGRLTCDELRLSFGLIDFCFLETGGCVQRGTQLSDGVVLSIFVTTGERTETLWEQPVNGSEAGDWQPEISLNLRRFQGKEATITLATSAGSKGNNDYDYVAWAGLRLYGEVSRQPVSPHIVLIDIDTLRKDRLGCYGYQRQTTPHLDEWADDALRFTSCTVTAPWTLPSTASIATGLAVHQHRVDRYPRAVTEDLMPLALRLRDAGYETFGIHESGYVGPDFGFDIGFDTYDSRSFKDPNWHEALRWISSRRSESPIFLFLHTYLVHAPYPYDPAFLTESEPSPSKLLGREIDRIGVMNPFLNGRFELSAEDRRYVSDMYDALVLKMDGIVGGFLDSLSSVLTEEDYVVVFTSDHGEELFEHGKMGHGHSLYRELLDVPLVIQLPQSWDGTRTAVVEEPVSTLDIAPTLLHLAGLKKPRLMPGRSLLKGFKSDRIHVASLSERAHSVQTAGFKLIFRQPGYSGPAGPRRELYRLKTDPSEQVNIADTSPNVANDLVNDFYVYVRKSPTAQKRPAIGRIRAAETKKLRALGYVWQDQPPPQSSKSGPDEQ